MMLSGLLQLPCIPLWFSLGHSGPLITASNVHCMSCHWTAHALMAMRYSCLVFKNAASMILFQNNSTKHIMALSSAEQEFSVTIQWKCTRWWYAHCTNSKDVATAHGYLPSMFHRVECWLPFFHSPAECMGLVMNPCSTDLIFVD